jgi:hypothetical protein
MAWHKVSVRAARCTHRCTEAMWDGLRSHRTPPTSGCQRHRHVNAARWVRSLPQAPPPDYARHDIAISRLGAALSRKAQEPLSAVEKGNWIADAYGCLPIQFESGPNLRRRGAAHGPRAAPPSIWQRTQGQVHHFEVFGLIGLSRSSTDPHRSERFNEHFQTRHQQGASTPALAGCSVGNDRLGPRPVQSRAVLERHLEPSPD